MVHRGGNAQVVLVEPVGDVAGFVDGRGVLHGSATADSSSSDRIRSRVRAIYF
jgi:hypothetical protein